MILLFLVAALVPPSAGASESGSLVGPSACAVCHPRQYNSWLQSPHGEIPPDSKRPRADCESCHGPGARHRRVPTGEHIVLDPGAERCADCHGEPSSSHFSYADKKKQVHPDLPSSQALWEKYFSECVREGQPVHLELFLMLDCPYGVEAAARLVPLAQEFAGMVDLRLTYIADLPAASEEALPFHKRTGNREEVCKRDPGRVSLLDPAESAQSDFFDEQLRQVLIRQHAPERFLEYFLARIQTPLEVPGAELVEWLGLDPTLMDIDSRRDEAIGLLQKDVHRCNRLGVFASPTLFVDDKEYVGPLTSVALLRVWCKAIGEEHPFCQGLPECLSDLDCDGPRFYCAHAGTPKARCVERPLIPVMLTMLDSLDCRSCFSDLLVGSALQLFPNLQVKWVDKHSKKGTEMAKDLHLERGPAYLFSASIEEVTGIFQQIEPVLKRTPEGYLVDPEILQSPLLWNRRRLAGSLELWFQPGDPLSDRAEAWWAEWIASQENPPQPEIHYIVREGTAASQPIRLELTQSPGSDTLILAPHGSPGQLELQRRYALWQKAPGTLPEYLKLDEDTRSAFKPDGDLELWRSALLGNALEAIENNRQRLAERSFVAGAGGALVHNHVWIAGWSPAAIPRTLYEWTGE